MTSSRSKITFKLNGKSQLPKYMNVNADSCSANLTIKKLLPCHSGTLYCFASNVHAIKNASIPIKGYDLTTQKGKSYLLSLHHRTAGCLLFKEESVLVEIFSCRADFLNVLAQNLREVKAIQGEASGFRGTQHLGC